MRMIFDLFHKLLKSEMFCFFHNCKLQPWNSDINFVLLFFCVHKTGLSRTFLKKLFSTCLGVNTKRFVPHSGLPVLDNCQNPNHTSNYLCWTFSVVDELTHILSGK